MIKTNKPKLLIADDSLTKRKPFIESLEKHYTVIKAQNGLQVLQMVVQHPDLACIVMDLTMPHLDGLKTTYTLKSDFSTYHIPIIILTSQIALEDMIHAVEMGADDYMKKPFEINELNARLLMNLRRAERDQNANPLTKLPGNAIINRTILMRLDQPLAILYADLDNFKVYNDKYGFNKGDTIIQYTANILSFTTRNNGNPSDFVGHIGGDDFVVISTPDKSEKIADEICKEFDKNIEPFYSKEDQKAKKVISHDRMGNLQEFPILSISVAIITNEKKELTSMPQIAQLAAELKHYAKSKPSGKLGSNYVRDRRTY